MVRPTPIVPAPSSLLSLDERKQMLSSSRFKLALTAFIALLLAALCTFVILLVAHIFHFLTPTMRQDLAWKVARGADDIAEHAELGMLLKDPKLIRQSFVRYENDADVRAIVVTDPNGAVLAVRGAPSRPLAEIFRAPEHTLSVSNDFISTWVKRDVEGVEVGRVALIASTARLEAGENLRHRLLIATGLAGALGLALSLSFVTFYVGPLIRVTERAFDGLERAAQEMAKKQRLEKELEIGARIQTCLLPGAIEIEGLEVSARMLPASEVGGDYYDAFPVPGGAFIGIGDVAGHGLTSGLVMLMVQSVVGALGRRYPDAAPRDIVSALNTILFDNIRHRLNNREHVTFTLFRYFGAGHFAFAGAHEELVVYRKRSGQIEFLPTPGTWLGAIQDIARFTIDSELALEPGDLLLLYTDGVTEAMNASREQFGLDRLAELVQNGASSPLDRLCAEIEERVLSWCNHAPVDDITVLALRRREDTA
ncbi:MAG TPA: PP2C family protein-serine/threonine phosphatase [Polyangiaceae bacterium]|jgi:serine phosphatase RsbU (regulator of sigma subunit)|nr:PP2C family protein-serine/threonine phosphatase [Polyangiaceae bacterium]